MDESQKNEILDLVGDKHSRKILSIISDESKSAKEIAEKSGYSLPTVYRRVNTFLDNGLIREKTELDRNGSHYKKYRATVEHINILLQDGEFKVEAKSKDGIDVTVDQEEELPFADLP